MNGRGKWYSHSNQKNVCPVLRENGNRRSTHLTDSHSKLENATFTMLLTLLMAIRTNQGNWNRYECIKLKEVYPYYHAEIHKLSHSNRISESNQIKIVAKSRYASIISLKYMSNSTRRKNLCFLTSMYVTKIPRLNWIGSQSTKRTQLSPYLSDVVDLERSS